MRELIAEGIDRLLGDQVIPEVLAAGARAEWNGALWDLLESSGFTRALCASEHGGSDASWFDAYPLLWASGYHSLPLPLPETLLGNYLLFSAGLPPVEGAIGLAEADGALDLRRQGDGWRVEGRLTNIPWGRHCRHVVTQVMHQGQACTVQIETAGLQGLHGLNLAREPRDGWELRGTPATVAPSPLPGDAVRVLGAYARAAQTAGACEVALEQAIRYAGERVQFGRPLAKFQAVQHQLAAAISEAAAVSAAADHVSQAASPTQALWEVAVAKITAAEAAGKVAAVTHAVHGAIGFTQEHALHHATQRLWSWRSEFGNLRWWSERLGHAVCRAGLDQTWAALIEPGKYLQEPVT